MTRTPYTLAKYQTGARAIFWLGMMLVGFLLTRTPMVPIGVVVTIFACLRTAQNLGMLIRIAAAEQILQSEPHTRLRQAYQRASLPRKVFVLLYSVAEIDGRAGPSEQDLVREFVLSKFQRPDLYADLRNWSAEALPEAELHDLVHELRAMLTRSECETLFTWCCLVTLVDRTFKDVEHDLLQRIAKHLGIDAHHARRLFLHAKQRVLGADRWGSGAGQGGPRSDENHGRHRPPPRAKPPREQALDVLGLERGATPEQIRKRHRELVKKFHPDAHTHLGEVAAREATARFREIQSAYETLTA